MPTRNYKPEQIVTIQRQIEVQMANGKTASQACKETEIHTQPYSASIRSNQLVRPVVFIPVPTGA